MRLRISDFLRGAAEVLRIPLLLALWNTHVALNWLLIPMGGFYLGPLGCILAFLLVNSWIFILAMQKERRQILALLAPIWVRKRPLKEILEDLEKQRAKTKPV